MESEELLEIAITHDEAHEIYSLLAEIGGEKAQKIKDILFTDIQL